MMKNFSSKSIFLIFGLAIFILIFINLFPFYWTFISSLQDKSVIMKGSTKLLPIDITFVNYRDLLFETAGFTAFRHYIFNSIKVGLTVALLSVILSIMGAYGLSHYDFPGKEFLNKFLLFIYVFPTILIMVPVYSIMAKLHLVDKHLGIILMHTTLAAPFCTWLLRSFFDSVPKDIEEAAIIDGCSKYQAIYHTIIPLAAPGILTAGIFALISSWGEYIFVQVLINSGSKKTVPLALAGYMGHVDVQWGRLLAGSALNVIPILILFLPLTKYFLKGFMEGALK